jgi:uncharacterized protein
MRIGVISDTHGLLRPEALEALRGSEHIIHAGDIGDPRVLDGLSEIAPLTAVRGNVDRGEWALRIPKTNVLEVNGLFLFVVHSLDELDLEPKAARFRAVIYGHSHRPKQEEKNGVLYFNPGSAGRKRFELPVTVGRLLVRGNKLRSEILNLERPMLPSEGLDVSAI